VSAATKLLDCLSSVKATGPGRWIALCPSHPDKRPSLSIRDTDGRCLVHCFGGCAAGDVVDALGLTLADLFDRPLGNHYRPTKGTIPARDLLEIIDQEALVVAMIALRFGDTKELSDEDLDRLKTAAARIGRARDHSHGY